MPATLSESLRAQAAITSLTILKLGLKAKAVLICGESHQHDFMLTVQWYTAHMSQRQGDPEGGILGQ